MNINRLQQPFLAIQNGVSIDEVLLSGNHGLAPLPTREDQQDIAYVQDIDGSFPYLVAGLYPNLKALLEIGFQQNQLPINLEGYRYRKQSELCRRLVTLLLNPPVFPGALQLRRSFRNDIMDVATQFVVRLPGFNINAEIICLTDANGNLFIHYINLVHRV